MRKINKNTFCVLPWSDIVINANGNIVSCCRHDGMKKENGIPYNYHLGDSINMFRNSKEMLNFRQELLSGNKPTICTKCWDEEKIGVKSMRQKYLEERPEYIDIVEKNGIKSTNNLNYIFITLGNSCNLKCRMCNGVSSSQIMAEKLNNNIQLTAEEEFTYKNKISTWFKDDNLITELKQIIPHLKRIDLMGGETLQIKKFYDILDLIIGMNYANKIKLVLTTNATKIPEHFFEKIKKFKEVIITISVDGIKNVGEYIRFPSIWNEVDKNIDRLVEFRNTHNNTTLCLNTVVQIYNIFDLEDILKYGLEKDVKVKLSYLRYPHHFKIGLIPDKYISEIEQYLIDLSNKYTDYNKNLEAIKTALTFDTYQKDELIIKLINETKKLDKIRNQDINKSIPKFVHYFKDYYN